MAVPPSRQPASLRQRALMWLAQREHSRKELHDKLLRWVRALETTRGLAPPASAPFPGAPGPGAVQAIQASEALEGPDVLKRAEPAERPELPDPRLIPELLDELEAAGHLSDARLLESRVHVRAARFGNLRIERELQQLGVAADEPVRATLRDSELQRAQAVWARKFGQLPTGASERGRQMRFLAGRGFSADTIRAVLRGAGCAEAEGDDQLLPAP
ncbi:MAG: RecX family transcriptional regulator [Betaproteobacteria bacterium]